MSQEVVVIGGGLAGLTAANFAARAGARVTVYERISELGGRARTRDEGGFRFNMGPHALYRAAEGMEALTALGIEPVGAMPELTGAGARHGGEIHALPGGFVSLVSTGLLRAAEKIEAGRFLAGLASWDIDAWTGRTLDELLESEMKHERVRELVRAIVRLTTYSHASDRLDAGAAIRQVQGAFGAGVLYLDAGWSQLIDALREKALAAGVRVRAGEGIRSVTPTGGGFSVAPLHGDEPAHLATRVILAAPPSECAQILRGHPVAGGVTKRWVDTLVPVRAASLEIGLRALPESKNTFALGIDEPTYFSVHSATARLAPEGGALIHCTRYLGPEEDPSRASLEAQLEGFVDQMQPGWREQVVHRTLLTNLVVSNAMVTRGGPAIRPPVELREAPGLYFAGDWVGDTAMLADCAFASGRAAGQAAAIGDRESAAA